MTDYIIPEVTLEEADTITRDIFGAQETSSALVQRIHRILTEDREHVAGLQDPWVEVPEGTRITEGVLYRAEEGRSAHEYVCSNDWTTGVEARFFVHRSDLPKVAQPESRRDRLIDEVIKASVWPQSELTNKRSRAAVGEWIDRVESAVKVVDGDE